MHPKDEHFFALDEAVMIRSVVWLACVCATVETARADPISTTTPASALFIGRGAFDPLLVGSFGGGGGSLGRSPGGLFLGVETGLARWLSSDATAERTLSGNAGDPNNGWAFGVRAGYQWRSGLALQLRFDDLGVDVARDAGSLFVAAGGVRYSLPFAIMPFAEVLVGAVFGGADTAVVTGLGVGVSVPIARHAIFDLTGRDWIADLDGSVRHIPTVMVGINLGFGG